MSKGKAGVFEYLSDMREFSEDIELYCDYLSEELVKEGVQLSPKVKELINSILTTGSTFYEISELLYPIIQHLDNATLGNLASTKYKHYTIVRDISLDLNR